MKKDLAGAFFILFLNFYMDAKAEINETCTRYVNKDMEEYSLGSFKGLPDDRFEVLDVSSKKSDLQKTLIQLKEKLENCASIEDSSGVEDLDLKKKRDIENKIEDERIILAGLKRLSQKSKSRGNNAPSAV